MNKEIITHSADQTIQFGEEFAQTLQSGDVVCLYGDLGAGKTTLAKGIAKGLGIVTRVISPTFSLVREHNVSVKNSELKIKKLYHIDLYRLEKKEEIQSIGITDILSDENGVVLIEWAEKLGDLLPKKRIQIEITTLSDAERKIQVIYEK
ncbi:MAG TPA: tRNA (adenosine(37)-N6)-threonylcarbamoyltransferase complex ATPase subunit type 1 TsaE [Candidatus Levybacteria bacterium]|nr:tRNA (adenosine(37)-N6)-threonylcarbamoyltransferase complex ATPase subunit type 1 TsaE [Candidatus Levybacteria bacterium]